MSNPLAAETLAKSRRHCLNLYVNGMGFRAIDRCTVVNHNTVINWIQQAGNSRHDAPTAEMIPDLVPLDALQPFVGSKKTSDGFGQQ